MTAGRKVVLDPNPVSSALQDVAVKEGLDLLRHEINTASEEASSRPAEVSKILRCSGHACIGDLRI